MPLSYLSTKTACPLVLVVPRALTTKSVHECVIQSITSHWVVSPLYWLSSTSTFPSRLKPNPVTLLVKLVTWLVICSAVIVCMCMATLSTPLHSINAQHTCLLYNGVDSCLLRSIVNEHFSSFIKWSTNSNICSTIHHSTHIITTGKCILTITTIIVQVS